MNPIREALIGKTITGVITRPGRDGLPELIMLALEDGSYMQFVMPQRRRRMPKNVTQRALASNESRQNNAQAILAKRAAINGTQELPFTHNGCG